MIRLMITFNIIVNITFMIILILIITIFLIIIIIIITIRKAYQNIIYLILLSDHEKR